MSDLFAPYAHSLRTYTNPAEAVERIKEIYKRNTQILKEALLDLARRDLDNLPKIDHATYPYLGVVVSPANLNIDARFAYGVALEPGVYGTTLTRPDLFEDYYFEQIQSLIEHHKVPVYVGESYWPIPIPYSDEALVFDLKTEDLFQMNLDFAMPNLTRIDDSILNGDYHQPVDAPKPLASFVAERVDFSLNRLHHYCGTSAEHFQRFILLTNYQRYMDAFKAFAHEQLASDEDYIAFVEPGDVITHKGELAQGEYPSSLPQMPAYHLKRKDGNGISFINIGVGPSNAKNITDHLAVLRPHCWIMLGHCAGLRRSQLLGDYVLAHGYVREDHVMDQDLPPWIPVPPIAEVQVALQQAVANITGQCGLELKTRMRTGTVVTTDNRNWELRIKETMNRFTQSRAIALDMESATIASNGFRMRVPYGTLLCVSDKPLHGELKLRGMANTFYRERVSQHLKVGLETMKLLREAGIDKLHSRKLRGFDEPPMR